EYFHEPDRRNSDRMLDRRVNDRLRRVTPGAAAYRRCFFEREAGRTQGPGNDSLAIGEQFDFQSRSVGHWHDRHSAPEPAFEFELSAGERSRIRLSHGAADREVSAAAGAATTVHGGPGKVEIAAVLGGGAENSQRQTQQREGKELLFHKACFVS